MQNLFRTKSVFLTAICLLCFVFVSKINACHLTGAEISYRYIGDSTGTLGEYEVLLKLFNTNFFCTGPIEQTYDMCVRNSCSASYSLTMRRKQGSANGVPVPYQDECVERTSVDYIPVTVWTYSATTVLNTRCADWRFIFNTSCCRIDQQLQNYVDPNAYGGIYIEARLNNTQGHNTSPQFQAPPVKSFCTNNFFVWSQATTEPDRDSVRYRFGQATNGILCLNKTDLTFAPGYRINEPLNVAPGTSAQIRNDGSIAFTTGNITGAYIVKIAVEEYRFHATSGFWYEVGSSERDMLVNYVNQCKSSVENGPQIDTSLIDYGRDHFSTDVRGLIGNNYAIPNDDSIPDPNNPGGYLYDWPVVTYNCFDTVINLAFDIGIQCYSISPDGSEFRVVGPDSILRPVTAAYADCGVIGETREISIKLHKPLSINGDYFLYIKKGKDDNTLLNSCGFALPEFFTMAVRVTNCPTPLYDLQNVSVINDDHIVLEWTYDSIPSTVVDGWYFWRSDDDGQTFNPIASRIHADAGQDSVWIDYDVQHQDVNSRSYHYRVQLSMDNEIFQPSRSVRSIFLRRTAVQADNWLLNWNHYDGWDNPHYHLMEWEMTRDSWKLAPIAGNPHFDNSMNYFLPENEGDYAIRVDAYDSSDVTETYVSISNYIYFTIEEKREDETEDLHIPNVFTPNDDGINDRFTIGGLNKYSSAYLVVTNRWGNVVFEEQNYAQIDPWAGVDQQSGARLSEGVYFYILRLYGGPDGDEVRTGQISLFR